MAKVRKKYDITAREGVKFCAAAIFLLLPQALFRGVALFVGWLVALLVGPVMELLVALLVGLACGTGYGWGSLTPARRFAFWWRKASVWMRKPWIEGCFLKVFVEI